jgi:hypothetical protein
LAIKNGQSRETDNTGYITKKKPTINNCGKDEPNIVLCVYKGNNKITGLRTILQRESPNSFTCFHGGTCVASVSGYSGSCVCKPGNTGYRCEIVLDPCSNIECQNGGECTQISTGFGFQCICQSGYNGVHCEIQSDPCEYIECANGGTCKSYTDHYVCICDPHYGGKHCKTLLMPSDQTVSNIPSNNDLPVETDSSSEYPLSEATHVPP